MADKKISQLTSLAQGDIATTTDVLAIVDTSATETKKATPAAIVGAAAAAGLTSVDINSGAIDGTTIGANSAAAGTFTNLTASGTVSFSGATVSNGGSVTTVDINGGTIDGATIATSDITVGTGKTLNVSAGTLTLADNQISGDKVEGGTINAITINTLTSTAVNATTVDATNVEVTNIKAKDGTAAATIADSTGVVSLSVNPTLSGGTANGVLYLNASKVATSGSALTFDGTNFVLASGGLLDIDSTNAAVAMRIRQTTVGAGTEFNTTVTENTGVTFDCSDSGGAIARSFIWTAAGSEQMRLNTTGLGIGTTSPTYKLDVSVTTNNGIRTTSSAGQQSYLGNTGGEAVTGTLNNYGFGIATNGSIRGYFDTSGNLGIGTTSPGAKLDVKQTGVGSATSVLLSRTTANVLDEQRIVWKADDLTLNYAGIAGVVNSGTTGSLHFQTATAGTLATKAILDSSGNLGLGVTPSAWGAGKAFDVGAGGALWSSANAQVQVLNNSYFDGTNFKYKNTAAASRYRQVDGAHEWYYAASGTAGNTITFTQAMTLDASGNLGIGTTSPSTRLHAKGTGGTIATFERDASGTIAYFNRNAGSGNAGAIIGADSVGGYFAGGNNTNNMVYLDSVNNVAQFFTNNAERARITAGGYFKASANGTYVSSTGTYHELRSVANENVVRVTNGIGSGYTSALALFNFTDYAPNTTTSAFIYCNDTAALRAEIRSNGGLANYQSNNVDLSDARTKNSITPAASMWGKIGALEIVTYKYNDQTHDDVNVGVIAQQVESVEPVWVDADGFGETPEGEEPLKTVYTKDITFAAIKALQEAMARIEQLEAKVAQLEAR